MRRLSAVLLILLVVASLLFSAEQINLRFPNWMFTEPGVKEWFYDGIAEFESQNPGIKVIPVVIPPGNYEDKLITEIAAGIIPDVFPVFTNMMPKLINLGILEPLDKWLNQTDWKDDLIKLQNAAIKDGVTYGVALTGSPHGLTVNKKLLEEAGVLSIPNTPEELYEAAKLVFEKTGKFGFAFTNSSTEPLFMYIYALHWVLGFGSDFSTPEGKPIINDPKNIEAIEFMYKLYEEGLVPKGVDTITMRRMFWNGEIAMMIDGPYTMTHIKAEMPDVYGNFTYVEPPTPTHAAVTGGAFWTIPAKSKHKEEAWKLIEFFNSKEYQTRWVEDTMQIAGQVVETTQEFNEKHPWFANMLDIAKKYGAGFGYAPPGLEVFANEFRNIVADHLGDIYAGTKTVKEALDEAQAEVESWLDEMMLF